MSLFRNKKEGKMKYDKLIINEIRKWMLDKEMKESLLDFLERLEKRFGKEIIQDYLQRHTTKESRESTMRMFSQVHSS